MPDNAVQRRSVPVSAGQDLRSAIRDAMPLLMRDRVLDAVLVAQARAGGPVTSQQARAAKAESGPLLAHPRAFTSVALAITRLGADERGRVLHAVQPDRKGVARWWVEERSGAAQD